MLQIVFLSQDKFSGNRWEFYKTDVENHTQTGDGTLNKPTITVVKMPFDNEEVPIQLKNDIANPAILVILAFCYSRNYVKFHKL
ncbi:MAG: hypothetical protein ACLP53_17445 [Isosphaeraceae bacterium]